MDRSPYITDEGIRLIQTGNIGVGAYKEQGFRYISKETFTTLRCKEVLVGDVLICRLADPVGRACLAPDLGVRMVTSVDVCMLRPKRRFDSRYLVYYLSSDQYLSRLNSASRGGTRERISRSQLGDVPIPVPRLAEQRTIAAFLDHETARIDRLIAKQERLIELLKEKRQAVISHAVTKGLNPDASMKDSGVEWLGEVPAHWAVRRLKHCATIQSGVAKGRSLDGGDVIRVPYLRVANVQDGFVDLTDVAEIEIRKAELTRYRLQAGDLLMNEGGDNDKLGRGTVWRGQIEPCIHQNHVFAVRTSGVEPEWVELVTQTDYARFHFFQYAWPTSGCRPATLLQPSPITLSKNSGTLFMGAGKCGARLNVKKTLSSLYRAFLW